MYILLRYEKVLAVYEFRSAAERWIDRQEDSNGYHIQYFMKNADPPPQE